MKTTFLPDEIRDALFLHATAAGKVPVGITDSTEMTLSWHLRQSPTGVDVDVVVATFTPNGRIV
jgi:hypothetical protein